MRATKGKHRQIRKRFAIVIGLAAVGVMALGAQTGAQTQAPTPRGQATPTCNGKPATIVGTDGPDQLGAGIGGTRGPDVIVGLGGNDIIVEGNGNDVICGGKGGDYLVGGKGNDILLGQSGRDDFNGCQAKRCHWSLSAGKDRCEGGKGNDLTYVVCEVEKSIEKSGQPPRDPGPGARLSAGALVMSSYITTFSL